MADFKAGLGELLAPYGVDSAIGIQVDRSWMKFRDLGLAPYRGYVELDAPFTVYPHEGLVAVPDVKSLRTLLKTASDERATYKNLAMIALKDVYRQGEAKADFSVGLQLPKSMARTDHAEQLSGCRCLRQWNLRTWRDAQPVD